MPLSEDEQRILSEIEQHLHASDPHLVRQVANTTLYSDSLRGIRWGVAGVTVGLVLLVALLTVNFVLSFLVGFSVMVGSAWYLQKNVRGLSRTGTEQAVRALRGFSLRDYLGFGERDPE